ncbi:MAG: 54S ribosomal protein, mitochondrial [Phylliscum demangeonii]|nr:MAG: 54S ribosomal protein, mitochondrial [Phylliscum demangeonii]
MPAKRFAGALRRLQCLLGSRPLRHESLMQPQALRWSRPFATEAPLPHNLPSDPPKPPAKTPLPPWEVPVLTTIYKFPSMRPLRFKHYPHNQLHMPLRKDLLHRAVIYEGDKTRQGTASTKWRSEVHGSNRKVHQQKGLGKARVGDRKSPIRKGGGVAFGPKPRDFSTKLPRKMYDIAWRTALSYRHGRGELIVVEDGANLANPAPGLVKSIFERYGWGKGKGRSLVITSAIRRHLSTALAGAGEEGRVLVEKEVDVKDLLEYGRLIVEESVLDSILRNHSSDLYGKIPRLRR